MVQKQGSVLPVFLPLKKGQETSSIQRVNRLCGFSQSAKLNKSGQQIKVGGKGIDIAWFSLQLLPVPG